MKNITKQDIEKLALLFKKCEVRNEMALYKIRKKEIRWIMNAKEIYNMSIDDINYFHRQVMIYMELIVL